MKLPALTGVGIPEQPQVAAMPDAIPELADLPTPSVEPLAPKTTAEAATETATPSTTASPMDVAAPPTSLPGLNLPAPPGTSDVVATAKPTGFPTLPVAGTSSTGFPTLPAATSLPEIDVEADAGTTAAIAPAPSGKTWKTTLAPTARPMLTSFNYRRQVLPDAIYQTAYNQYNRHLPTRVTVSDYDALLVKAIASNDVDGTRALLNTRRSLDLKTIQGDRLLQVARASGATDTENLLRARGVR